MKITDKTPQKMNNPITSSSKFLFKKPTTTGMFCAFASKDAFLKDESVLSQKTLLIRHIFYFFSNSEKFLISHF